MEGMGILHYFALLLLTTTLSVILSVNGQITTPCTTTLISTFTPCLNFITGSSPNGSITPTQSCCDAFKSLAGDSIGCACLLITANVPIQLPINRTLSLSLPRACNTGGVPIKCKASGAPLPAPGPAYLFGPAPAPTTADSPLSPGASKAVAPATTTEDLAPASPPVITQTSPGIRPVLTPSASSRYCTSPPSVLLLLAGIIIFKSYF